MLIINLMDSNNSKDQKCLKTLLVCTGRRKGKCNERDPGEGSQKLKRSLTSNYKTYILKQSVASLDEQMRANQLHGGAGRHDHPDAAGVHAEPAVLLAVHQPDREDAAESCQVQIVTK